MDQVIRLSRGASRVAQCFSLLLFILTLGMSGAASARLIDRGPDLVYDDVLDITWVRDASLCVTLDNCVDRSDQFVTGGMEWPDANFVWAEDLVYRGFSDWRLPYASVAAGEGPTSDPYGCSGAGGPDEVACRDNEMGYMFFYNLDGNPLVDDKTGSQTAVGGEMLTGIQSDYWSGTGGHPNNNPNSAWFFSFFDGGLSPAFELVPFAAWAVRPGDVAAAVPEPSSLLLIGVGALAFGMTGRARRRP